MPRYSWLPKYLWGLALTFVLFAWGKYASELHIGVWVTMVAFCVGGGARALNRETLGRTGRL